MKLSPLLERKHRALVSMVAASGPVAVANRAGVRVKGVTNGSQGVTLAGRRFRRSRQAGLRSLGHNAALELHLRELYAEYGRLVVRIVRVAPNRLDGDNLEAALKRVRDGLAKCIGVDDRHPSVEYVADDERGGVREYAVRIEVFRQDSTALPKLDWRRLDEPGTMFTAEGNARAAARQPPVPPISTQLSAATVERAMSEWCARPNVRRPR